MSVSTEQVEGACQRRPWLVVVEDLQLHAVRPDDPATRRAARRAAHALRHRLTTRAYWDVFDNDISIIV